MKRTKEEWKELIDKVCGHHKRLDSVTKKMTELGVYTPEGELDQAIWKAWEYLLYEIDPDDWIFWFIYENEYGKCGLRATVNSKEIRVCNSKDMAKVMHMGYQEDAV